MGQDMSKKIRKVYNEDNKINGFLETQHDIDNYYTKLKITANYAWSAEHNEEVSASSLELENIFDNDGNKILIVGAPGVGKSTLLQYICYKWSVGKLWNNKFDVLFRVELKNLYSWIADGHDKMTYKDDIERYADFIWHASFRTESGITSKTILSILKAKSKKLLLILDGYDEIINVQNTNQIQIKSAKNEVSKILKTFDNIITTSRPNAIIEGGLVQADGSSIFTVIENLGFDEEGRREYINRYYKNNPILRDSLINFINNDYETQEICKIPLNVEILCSIWSNQRSREALNQHFTRTILYTEIDNYLSEWYKYKVTPEEQKYRKLVNFVKQLAFEGLAGNQIRDIPENTIKKIIVYYEDNEINYSNFMREVNSMGFLHPVYRSKRGIQDNYFTHKTLQEYLAAKYLLQDLSSTHQNNYQKAMRFITDNKYESYVLEVLKFLSGLVANVPDSPITNNVNSKEQISKAELVDRFWQAILYENEDVIVIGGLKQITLLMHLLAQYGDDNSSRIKKYRDYVDKNIALSLLEWERQLSESQYHLTGVIDILLTKLYSDNVLEVIDSINILSNLNKDTSRSTIIVKAISDLLDNSNMLIVEAAVYALGKIAYNRNEILEKLLTKFDINNTHITLIIMEVLSKLKYSEELLLRLLDTLIKGNDLHLILGAIEALNNIEYYISSNIRTRELVINTLIDSLANQNWNNAVIINSSIQLLAKLGKSKEEIINDIILLLSEKTEQIRKSTDILGNIGKGYSIVTNELLHKLHNHLYMNIHKVAESDIITICKIITTLGKIGEGKEVVKALLDRISHQNEVVRKITFTALKQITERYPEYLGDAAILDALTIKQVENKLDASISGTSTDIKSTDQMSVIKMLGKLGDKSSSIRSIASKSIGYISKSKSDLTDQEIVEKLIKKLSSAVDSVRIKALQSLTQIIEEQSELISQNLFSKILENLNNDSPFVRMTFLRLLNRIIEKLPELISLSVSNIFFIGLKDEEQVKQASLECLELLVQKYPGFVEQILDFMSKEDEIKDDLSSLLHRIGFYDSSNISGIFKQLLSRNQFIQKKYINILSKADYNNDQIINALNQISDEEQRKIIKVIKEARNKSTNIIKILEIISTKYSEFENDKKILIKEEEEKIIKYLEENDLDEKKLKFVAEYIVKHHKDIKFGSNKIIINNQEFYTNTNIRQKSLYNDKLLHTLIDSYRQVGIEPLIIYPASQSDLAKENNLMSIIDSDSKLTLDKWKLSILRNNDNTLILLESRDEHGRLIESIKSNLREYSSRTYGIMHDYVFANFIGKSYLGSSYFTSVDITTVQKEELSSYIKRLNQADNYENKPCHNAYIDAIWHSLGNPIIKALSLDLPEFNLYVRVSTKIDNWILLGKTFEEASSLNDQEYKSSLVNIALRIDDHEIRISKLEESLLNRFNMDTKKEQESLSAEVDRLHQQLKELKIENQIERNKINAEINKQNSIIEELSLKCKEFPKFLELANRYEIDLQNIDKKYSQQDERILAISKIIEDNSKYHEQIKELYKKSAQLEEQAKLLPTSSVQYNEVINKLEDHHREIIRLKISAGEHQLALDIMHPIIDNIKDFDVIIKDRQFNNRKPLQLEKILTNPYKAGFYHHLVQQLNAIYLASTAVQTDILSSQRVGTIGNIGNVLHIMGSYIPMIGAAVQIFGSLLYSLDKANQGKMIKRYSKIVDSPVDMDILVKTIAIELLIEPSPLQINKLDQDETLIEKMCNILFDVIGNIDSIIQFIKSSTEEKKEFLLFKGAEFVQDNANKLLPDINEESLESTGIKHASVLVNIIAAKIYNGDVESAFKTSNIADKATILINLVLDEYGIIIPEISSKAEKIAFAVIEKGKILINDEVEKQGNSFYLKKDDFITRVPLASKHPERENSFSLKLKEILTMKKYRCLIEKMISDNHLEEQFVTNLVDVFSKFTIFEVYEPYAVFTTFKQKQEKLFNINNKFEQKQLSFMIEVRKACDKVLNIFSQNSNYAMEADIQHDCQLIDNNVEINKVAGNSLEGDQIAAILQALREGSGIEHMVDFVPTVTYETLDHFVEQLTLEDKIKKVQFGAINIVSNNKFTKITKLSNSDSFIANEHWVSYIQIPNFDTNIDGKILSVRVIILNSADNSYSQAIMAVKDKIIAIYKKNNIQLSLSSIDLDYQKYDFEKYQDWNTCGIWVCYFFEQIIKTLIQERNVVGINFSDLLGYIDISNKRHDYNELLNAIEMSASLTTNSFIMNNDITEDTAISNTKRSDFIDVKEIEQNDKSYSTSIKQKHTKIISGSSSALQKSAISKMENNKKATVFASTIAKSVVEKYKSLGGKAITTEIEEKFVKNLANIIDSYPKQFKKMAKSKFGENDLIYNIALNILEYGNDNTIPILDVNFIKTVLNEVVSTIDQNNKCIIMAVSEIVYDNKLLNHPQINEIFKIAKQYKGGIRQITDLGMNDDFYARFIQEIELEDMNIVINKWLAFLDNSMPLNEENNSPLLINNINTMFISQIKYSEKYDSLKDRLTLQNDFSDSSVITSSKEIIAIKNEHNNEELPPLTIVTSKEENFDCLRHASNMLNYFIKEQLSKLDLNWYFKKIFYYKDLQKFERILKDNELTQSIDILKNPSDFKKILLKFHPDKSGQAQDFIFVKEMQEKFNTNLDIQKLLNEKIQIIQPIIYKVGMGLKILDTVIDVARVIHEPKLDNAKKVVMDATYLYSIYSGVNGYSTIISGTDILYKLYQCEYAQALKQTTIATSYVILPTMIGYMEIPYIGFIYSSVMTAYIGYGAITNMYSLYTDYNKIDSESKSVTAYKDFFRLLSNSPLQLVYDFSITIKEYETKISDIHYNVEKSYIKQQLEVKGDFGKKLYNYIYEPYLKEKYDLLNKVVQGTIKQEEINTVKANHIKITFENLNYDHCMEIKEVRYNKEHYNKGHYYCYNEEYQILDHLFIGENRKDIEIIEHL